MGKASETDTNGLIEQALRYFWLKEQKKNMDEEEMALSPEKMDGISRIGANMLAETFEAMEEMGIDSKYILGVLAVAVAGALKACGHEAESFITGVAAADQYWVRTDDEVEFMPVAVVGKDSN